MRPPLQDGETPSTPDFVKILRSLAAPRTRVLVASELRSSEVRDAFQAAARAAFPKVRRLAPEELPPGCRGDHIEVMELRVE
jgi:hypothetical protein